MILLKCFKVESKNLKNHIHLNHDHSLPLPHKTIQLEQHKFRSTEYGRSNHHNLQDRRKAAEETISPLYPGYFRIICIYTYLILLYYTFY